MNEGENQAAESAPKPSTLEDSYGTPMKNMEEAVNSLPSREELLNTYGDHQEEASSQKAPTFEAVTKAMDEMERYEKNRGSIQERIEPEYSETEKEAMRLGWVPKDQFEGKENSWTDAPEFLRTKKLIEQIKNLRKDNEGLKKRQDKMLHLMEKRHAQESQERADKYLEMKRTAIQEGDVELAEKYEQEYYKVKPEIESFKQIELKKENPDELQDEVLEFVERNKDWWNDKSETNIAMKGYARVIDEQLAVQFPNWPLKMRLEEVEKKVKSFYSQYFSNPNRNRAPMVESRSRRPSKKISDVTYAELPPDAKKVVDAFIKPGSHLKFSRDEYAQKLLETGAITYE